MSEELTLLPCPLCQATAHVEYHNGYLRVICEGEPGCPFRMGGKRFVFTDECYDWWNNLPRALTWTTEPPKVAGWYWFKDDLFCKKGGIMRITDVWIEEIKKTSGPHDQWAGPIPEPREPKE